MLVRGQVRGPDVRLEYVFGFRPRDEGSGQKISSSPEMSGMFAFGVLQKLHPPPHIKVEFTLTPPQGDIPYEHT